ncbi:MAG: S49 family peptidase [Alphaproteobacteria bacterium]|nr:S49 family peptidase [Alphaproteobacteria bacterium]
MLAFHRPPPVVAVVRLEGTIGRAGLMRAGLTDDGLRPSLERAFRLKGLKAVALVINSPGGSPAQSALIHQRIRHMARKKNVPIMAFVEDVAASGGYWLAISADEVFVDPNSIVGSIGVIYAGFGFAGAIEKLGIERRMYTAGDRKSLLDPFRPEREEDIQRLRAVQDQIHENFKDVVRARRGQRLKGEEDALFSGEFWLGREAVSHGLADGLGEMAAVLKERFGEDVRLRRIGPRRGWLRRRFGALAGGAIGSPLSGDSDYADAAGGFVDGVLSAVEARALWSRFGL